MYTLLLAVIYLVFISLGLPDSLLGAGWPVMHQTFGVPLSWAGAVSMIVAGGTICSSLSCERLTAKFSTRGVTLASVLLSALSLLGFSLAGSFWALCLWAVPYGLSAGCIDSAINNYVALHYRSRHMSWLHSFWGVGTIISPVIMSRALAGGSWRLGYRTVAVLQLAIGAVVLLTLPLWNARKAPAAAGPARVLGVGGALKIPGAPSLFAGFFAYCAGESTAILWASSYLVGARGFSEARAAASAGLFYAGITAGRFLSGFVADRLGDRQMIRLGVATAALGVLALVAPAGEWGALAGLALFGLGCAPVYPAIIHSTPQNFGAENSQGLIGMQMASAYLGSTFVPPVFGLLAGRAGLQWMPLFLAAFLALLAVMTERTWRRVDGAHK